MTGDGSKVHCCKEQYCIGTWNVRSMNQGKLDVVKQELARVNIDVLGISEQKWTGMGEFNSDDHYFGSIKTRVAAYMKDLDEELWKLGILAKTEHNEAAPAQHELAPIYATTNMAVDHNLLIMEYMKKIAEKHGLVCLLHEKPYAGVNGSGKHNNWSLSTDKGKNLLDAGKTPEALQKAFSSYFIKVCATNSSTSSVRSSTS